MKIWNKIRCLENKSSFKTCILQSSDIKILILLINNWQKSIYSYLLVICPKKRCNGMLTKKKSLQSIIFTVMVYTESLYTDIPDPHLTSWQSSFVSVWPHHHHQTKYWKYALAMCKDTRCHFIGYTACLHCKKSNGLLTYNHVKQKPNIFILHF